MFSAISAIRTPNKTSKKHFTDCNGPTNWVTQYPTSLDPRSIGSIPSPNAAYRRIRVEQALDDLRSGTFIWSDRG